MPDTPLNPDALEAAENMFIFMCADGYTPKAEDAAESLVSAYLAVAQPEVNSVEELDALPEGTVLLVTDKRPGVGKSSWELFSDVLELRSSDGELEPKAWASPAYTTEYTCKSLWEIADQINVLYRPEVKP